MIGRLCLVAAMIGFAWSGGAAQEKLPEAFAIPKPVVVEARVLGGASNEMLQEEFDRLVCAVTGCTNITEAWRSLVKPSERVGIKITAPGVHRAFVEATIRGLRAAGVGDSRIVVWDRDKKALQQAGFLDGRGESTLERVAVKWIRPAAGYDPGAILYAAVPGTMIWGDRDFQYGTTEQQLSNTSYLSFILTSQVDKVINLGVARAASGVGLHGAVAGLMVDNADNWRRFYRNGAGDSVRDAWETAKLSDKTVLHFIDARFVQIAQGPGQNSIYQRRLDLIAASRDPFALDALLVRKIDPLAVAERLPSLRRGAAWLFPESDAVDISLPAQ